ncbi:GLPGLI family protein [Marinifilum sp. D714]|uniref:GLPGLI family protein n=1 Tax=Marinifilum sp. D714 TaxID=2937523 RepID=UPI0027CBFDD5|nr:GLPGLI family protein [Marinifilum sp. D714]MDQ2179542.1 GLPGLI family protein [Marinifilum sp. D714]
MIKYCFLFATILMSTCCYSQEFVKIDAAVKEFYYDYTFQQDSTDHTSEKYQEMVLQVGENKSKFTAVNKLYTDSLLFTVKDMDPNAGFLKIWPQLQALRIHKFCTYNIYKNYPQKKNVRFVGDLGSKKTLMVDEEININWKIETQKDTTISGYSCQMATCNFAGRDYIAWYTMEIPVSDGPYKFHGLPGLIVRISDMKNQHIFQMYKVKNCDTSKDMLFVAENNIQETTAPKFAKAMKAHIADMYRKYGGSASPIQYKSPEQESKVLRNIRSRNNYIERY